MMKSSELASACAQHMFSTDSLSQSLGMQIQTVDEGKAVVSMQVKQDMLNGHQTCHGGIIFSLADSAFAFACNSQDQVAVASNCSIDFLRPALIGDKLTAISEVQYQGNKTGVYQTMVTNQNKQLIAIFKGKSARLGMNVLNRTSGESI
ncbi:MAG: acyl-CoA thioesterase [Bermanella sp.]|jgi:acyl-CoA thioesterase|uniref:hydroxyphenylacetyl-CoA thioesterase PaaI n=1 Tax=Glaciecola sp. 33A TaxID=2057807 RepID=UPI0018E3A190|nr:hydroxyphenylacetyl-CoA thioesterase PaaI [Glaciecola sp. 33A]